MTTVACQFVSHVTNHQNWLKHEAKKAAV